MLAGDGQLISVFIALMSNELIGSQRIITERKIVEGKKLVESAVKGDQKSFQLCSVTLLFYTTNF